MSRFVILGLVLLSLLPGCGAGATTVPLGSEFSLAVGQSAVITGEDLEITFDEVVEDSRCPRGVVCIQAGRVSVQVQVNSGGNPVWLVLSEPGLTGEPARQDYQGYRLTYRVTPYPEAGKLIAREDYRLIIKVSK